MSVHLKTDAVPKAKRGELGAMAYEEIADEPLDEATMDGRRPRGRRRCEGVLRRLPSSSEPGMNIVQFRRLPDRDRRPLRMASRSPPSVRSPRPTSTTTSTPTNRKTGCRAPARRSHFRCARCGKSTFAQAVARYISDHDYSVKTMEKPRDLQVGPDITQYTELGGEMAKTADALLMVRPDYTIYDEVRKPTTSRSSRTCDWPASA